MTSFDDYEINWADIAADELAWSARVETLLARSEAAAAERARTTRIFGLGLLGLYVAMAALLVLTGCETERKPWTEQNICQAVNDAGGKC